MASCLSRHDQMVYSIFQNRAPQDVKFFSNDSKVKESIYQDGLTTNNDHQSFQNPHYSKFGNIFIFFLFKIKHHPSSRKKPNEKLFFSVFFHKFKTLFFVLTRVKFFVIKFINTKTWKHSFQLFLQKITTRVSVLLSTCKRKIRTKVSLHVS